MKAKSGVLPTIFLGHGSPMNAIAQNSFTQTLEALGKKIPVPEAILMISAHWMTQGTFVTDMESPKTIHDFSGFPDELHKIQYLAKGSPKVVQLIQERVAEPKIQLDTSHWGLDHGAWGVLRQMYPQANIPVVQMSLDMTQPPQFHYELGKKLKTLRSEGILVMGSGNIVHNLRQIRWEENAEPFEWAHKFDEWVKSRLEQRDFETLVNDFRKSTEGQMSVPTLEHYLPLLYILGMADKTEPLSFDYAGIQNGSISMRCVRFG